MAERFSEQNWYAMKYDTDIKANLANTMIHGNVDGEK